MTYRTVGHRITPFARAGRRRSALRNQPKHGRAART